MYDISVILPTARKDYPILEEPELHMLEITINSLMKQTFKNFEVIVIDALHDTREFPFDKVGFPVKHVPVHPNHRFWLDRKRWNVCGALNTGILYAEGELIVRIDDCSEFEKTFLEDIWKAYQNGLWLQAMHIRFFGGKPARFDAEYREKGYEAKYSTMVEPKDRFDILRNMYGEDGIIRDTRYPKVVQSGGKMIAPYQWLYGYSSFTLQAALQINGFDELFDGDKCFPPGHLVTGIEVKKIEDVEIGDLVLTHRGRLRKVTKTHKRWYEGPIIDFTIYGGPNIKTTPGHQILIRMPVGKGFNNHLGKEVKLSRTGWVKAGSLAEDFIKNNKWAHKRRKYRVIFSAPKTQTWIKKIKLGKHEIKLNENLARLIGYYVADGSAGRYLCFTFNKSEKNYAEDVLDLCNAELKFLKKRLPERKHGSISIKNNALNVRFHVGKDFATEWKAWIGHNAHNKHIPYEILYNSDLDICRGFIVGYERGDGYRDEVNRRQYPTVSIQLAHDLKLICGRLGKYSNIYNSIQKAGYGKGKNIHHVIVVNPNNKRRHVKKSGHLTLSDGTDIRGYFYYRPIRDIQIVEYRGYVYHLEVDEDKSYQVHDVCVHNSQEDQDFGSRLDLAGYRNLFLLDVAHQVIEHEHEPIPEEIMERDAPNIKCNYAIYLMNRRKNQWKANTVKLTEEDVELIRAESLRPPCSPRPDFYVDDCRGELFDLWVENQNLFNLREERLDV